jgi:hypothetical protein
MSGQFFESRKSLPRTYPGEETSIYPHDLATKPAYHQREKKNTRQKKHTIFPPRSPHQHDPRMHPHPHADRTNPNTNRLGDNVPERDGMVIFKRVHHRQLNRCHGEKATLRKAGAKPISYNKAVRHEPLPGFLNERLIPRLLVCIGLDRRDMFHSAAVLHPCTCSVHVGGWSGGACICM